jgi:hypothetical protein
MAGVPFEMVERLATRDASAAARDLLVRQAEFSKAKSDVENLLQSRRHDLSKELFRAWRRTIRSGAMPPPDPPSGVFAICRECASNLASAEICFDQSLQRELEIARQALLQSARTVLPAYLVFASGSLREVVAELLEKSAAKSGPLPTRTKKARAKERHLLLYLQRVCAKNDTLSEFGPGGWGTIDREISLLRLAPKPGIVKRESFLERWTAHGVAAALNADPEIRLELSPRLHPNGRLHGGRFVFTDNAESVSLESHTIEFLAHCDGKTPAHSLGVEMQLLEQLARQNIIRWEVEVPALEPYAFNVLISDILQWRDGPTRKRWLDLLQPIGALPIKFAQTTETASRIEIMDEARVRLDQLGAGRTTSNRFLYSAVNPIGEECLRECGFSISENLINEVASDAAPWIDLWRDCYAFIASRVAEGLRGLVEKAPRQNGALPLPAFLRHCAMSEMALTGPGMVALAHIAFQEVKAAFREQLRPHADSNEYELTLNDCHVVRKNFEYPKFDEYTYPSADMQLAAKSVEALAAGQYQWILAELHPPAALLHHGFYWSCPDKAGLSHALTRTLFGRPSFYFGFSAADFTATTTVHLFETPPELSNFVASQRGNSNWRTVQPADTEVFVDDATGDVCLRKTRSHEYLGSFARSWLIPLGFHPFQFGLAPNTPRLRCGHVIVQRRAWTVRKEELGTGDFTGISRDLVLAIERLRAQKNWPRYVYIRPSEQALRRSGAEGRDKDTKPVFIDLESYLFLEIFHRWLTKSGELEVTEMLPDPDHLPWREPDGRRTFELRTLIIPRS